MQLNYLIVGGGIIGLSVAMQILKQRPGAALMVLEKEDGLARHQTSHNSGVVHSGVYYEPGSLKARFCRDGMMATVGFCQERGIPFEQCGKLLVATNDVELARMGALEQRAQANGLNLERLDAAELKRREPRISGLGALLVPTTGIVEYAAIAREMATSVQSAGGKISINTTLTGVREGSRGVVVETTQGDYSARVLVGCAELMADRLARLCGIETDFQIVPFRGEYCRLPPDKDRIIRHLIYPIPDPALPFLGVHLTRMIGGYVTVGPNAVLSLAREGYRGRDFKLRDMAEILAFPGFWRLLARHPRAGATELLNSWNCHRYLALCRRFCPELTIEDMLPHPSGVRAQAVTRDGKLLHDFLIRRTAHSVHVCNAPSPAATSAIPIGQHVARLAIEMVQS